MIVGQGSVSKGAGEIGARLTLLSSMAHGGGSDQFATQLIFYDLCSRAKAWARALARAKARARARARSEGEGESEKERDRVSGHDPLVVQACSLDPPAPPRLLTHL